MFVHIKKCNEYREQRELSKLIEFSEKILTTFYLTTPDKYMPRKYEFITEICNIIGLAHMDKIKFKSDYPEVSEKQLRYIFNIPIIDTNPVKYIFGDRSTYINPAASDIQYLRLKEHLDFIESKLKHSQIPVERCHYYHEISKLYVQEGRFDEVRTFARKVVDESMKSNNLLWSFLGTYMTCKSYILQTNFQQAIVTLKTAKEIAVTIKKVEMVEFAESAIEVIGEIP